MDQRVESNIPCPVCRDVTTPPYGDVTNLGRAVLHDYIQGLILQLPKQPEIPKLCTNCDEGEAD